MELASFLMLYNHSVDKAYLNKQRINESCRESVVVWNVLGVFEWKGDVWGIGGQAPRVPNLRTRRR